VTAIALDAMGGDHAPAATVAGAAELSRESSAPQIVLVGDAGVIRELLDSQEHDAGKLTIVHTDQAIPMDADPRSACEELPRASMILAAEMVKAGDADALVSAGNTGAVIMSCARSFARLEGVKRCALGAVFPTERRRGARDDPFSLILDAGLTVELDADALVGFAIMGSAYASRISSNPDPTVALLNNGTEPNKGPPAVVEAHRQLAAIGARGSMNFIGNIEGLDIPAGTADVIVTGGFMGNIVLKMLEGVAQTVRNLGRYAMHQSVMYKAGLALLSPGLKQLKEVTDWQQYGGAPVLGFDQICIKAHGRSSARAVKNAIKVAHKAHRTGLVEAIQEGIAHCGSPAPDHAAPR
jgi:glycerol-3-phosphate acyltransferase PlsX